MSPLLKGLKTQHKKSHSTPIKAYCGLIVYIRDLSTSVNARPFTFHGFFEGNTQAKRYFTLAIMAGIFTS